MKHRLTLNYTLGRGELAPFLDALADGVALAGQCPLCDRTTFPPERRCRCTPKGDEMAAPIPRKLTGLARIVWQTGGPGGQFALAQFDGADNRTVCRIANPEGGGNRATLVASLDGRPGIVVQMTGDEIEITG